jgi:predicted DNA binding CopG/RHH family protein
MKKPKLPNTDSIQKLAEFWDTHDLTDFEDNLQEVAEPVFARGSALNVPLESRDIAAIERLAQSKGVSPEQLVRSWVLQRIARGKNARPTKRSA